MRTRSKCLALAIVLLCPFASAQWVQMNGLTIGGTPNVGITALSVRGSELFVGAGFNVGGPKDGSDSLFIFRSTDNGESWVRQMEARVNAIAILSTDAVMAGANGAVLRSTNNGTSWTAIDSGLTATTYVMSLAVSGTNLFAGTDEGVYLSTDNGISWKAVNTGLTFTYVTALAVSGSNLLVGTGGGGVFRSTDNGTSWTNMSTDLLGLDPNGCFVNALMVAGTNIFVAISTGGAFLSTNNGISWTAINDGLPKELYFIDSSYASIASFASSGRNIFAGTYGSGVFLSTNNGTSWQSVHMDLDQRYVLGLNDKYVFLGSFNTGMVFSPGGKGVWRRPLSEIVSSVRTPSNGIPHAFGLSQNYPNPFNPSTTIKYELPKTSQVALTVNDILGREVSVLVNERRDAGHHEVKFDGSNLASGVYFYTLQAGDFTLTKRLLLLK